MILLRPSAVASNTYRDNEVSFRFQLVSIHDMDARDILDHGPLCLAPFTPLMQHGSEELDRADRLIHDSDRPRVVKADMLTSMAILAGLVSDTLPAQLIARRRDVMKESAAYNIIKEDGFQEGRQVGREEGREEGRQIGRREGMLASIKSLLEKKFGNDGTRLFELAQGIERTEILEALSGVTFAATTAEEVAAFLRGQ